MPPWWVYKITGSVATFVKLFPCVSHPAKGLILWAQCSTFVITLFRLLLPQMLFYQVPVIVLRDGVELNSFAVKLRFHRLPVYPAGVRGVDLSV